MKHIGLFTYLNIIQTKPCRCILCLIENKKWKKARKALLAEQHEWNNYATYNCRKPCREHLKYPSLLHFACKYHPTCHFIKHLISVDNASPFRMDSMGRYPLHVACEYGASPKVIRYLVEQNPQATSLRDADGNSSLHLLLWRDSITESDDAFFALLALEDLLRIIGILCQTAPALVTIQNFEGNTALDDAIVKGLDISIIFLLRSLILFEEQGRSSMAWLKEIEETGHILRWSKKNKVMPT